MSFVHPLDCSNFERQRDIFVDDHGHNCSIDGATIISPSMRLQAYFGASTAAAACCLLKAFHQRPNFYSATVYLSQSNACLLILTNLLLVLVCTFLYGLQRLLYGPIRPIEMEQLSEKAWYAVLDTLLAMPSFREDVGGWLLTMFVLLLAGKVWGWIGEGRVEVMEQQQGVQTGKWFHARLGASLALSVIFDLAMLNFCVDTVMADPRPGMMVIFTFEFAVLAVFSSFTLSRYGLSLFQRRVEEKQMEEAMEARKTEIRAERTAAIAAQQANTETTENAAAPALPSPDDPVDVDPNEIDVPGWEQKRRYLFGLELFTDFLKLCLYIVFFTVSITFNGLPMHIMRDVYMTFASFSKRLSDYIAYRKATSDMNTRYPDATATEIRDEDCIVCRESMVAWEQPAPPPAAADQQAPPAPAIPVRRDEGLRAKKLPCGHILHLRCLKAWLERQQVCPTCRRPVISPEQAAAGVPGQAGVPNGANAGAVVPGQVQQRPARLHRARIFNLGPVRIGFVNGNGDQVQNIVDQMRPGGQAGNEAAGAQGRAEQQQGTGPNHLGLQVPYNNTHGHGHRTHRNAHGTGRSQVPTQAQFNHIEQRLMVDAINLGLDQQQLATLRLMEAELARLRASYVHLQPVQPAAPRPQVQVVNLPNGGGYTTTTSAPAVPAPALGSIPAQPLPRADMLQGNASQAVGSGHESLPQGMVLPEGWTVMPLTRAAGGAGPNVVHQVRTARPEAGPSVTQATNGSTSVPGPAPIPAQQPSSSHPATVTPDAGPTDPNGSPLFVPATAVVASVPETSTSADTFPLAAFSAEPKASASVSTVPSAHEGEQDTRPPWTANGGDWSFAPKTEPTAADASHQEESAGQSSKGKGKAVEVEDASDAEG